VVRGPGREHDTQELSQRDRLQPLTTRRMTLVLVGICSQERDDEVDRDQLPLF